MFLSNTDTYNIAFDENNPLNNSNINERTLFSYLVSWKIKPNKDKQYLFLRAYEIKKNVYNTKYWKKIR